MPAIVERRSPAVHVNVQYLVRHFVAPAYLLGSRPSWDDPTHTKIRGHLAAELPELPLVLLRHAALPVLPCHHPRLIAPTSANLQAPQAQLRSA